MALAEQRDEDELITQARVQQERQKLLDEFAVMKDKWVSVQTSCCVSTIYIELHFTEGASVAEWLKLFTSNHLPPTTVDSSHTSVVTFYMYHYLCKLSRTVVLLRCL
jgi:hypothetical protein